MNLPLPRADAESPTLTPLMGSTDNGMQFNGMEFLQSLTAPPARVRKANGKELPPCPRLGCVGVVTPGVLCDLPFVFFES